MIASKVYSIRPENNLTNNGNTKLIDRASNIYIYLPTPPLGQDMTQGQFLSGV